MAPAARARVLRLALLGGAALVVALATLWPLLAARYLPLLDAPNHLGAIAIWRGYDDPSLGFSRAYELNLRPVPYWGYFGAVRLLAVVLPLEVANKVFIGGALLLLPAGLAVYLREEGRPPLLALAAAPLGWSYNMALGFVAYVAGVGVLFLALALLARLARRPSWPLVAACAATGLVLYFLHPLVLLVWGLATLVYAPRRAPLIVLPALALFVAVFVLAPTQGLRAHGAGAGVAGLWNSPAANLRLLPVHVFDFVAGRAQRWLLLAVVGAALAGGLLVRRGGERGSARPLLIVALVALLYFALPEHLYRPVNWWMVNGRLAVVLVALLFACVPRGALPGWRALVVAPACAGAVLYGLAVGRRFADFDGRAADFRRIVGRLPRDPSVLTVVFPPLGDPAVNVDAWREFPSYVQVERGGYNPWSWGDGFPMRTRPEARKPAPPGHHPERLNVDVEARAYEYLLTRAEPPGVLDARPDLELVERVGDWRLWRWRR